MANQMGAAPGLHDAASLHDSYMRSTSPCATHTCPTRLLAYEPHIVRLAELAEAASIAGQAYRRRILGAQVGQSRDVP